jgi:hypothetical protein
MSGFFSLPSMQVQVMIPRYAWCLHMLVSIWGSSWYKHTAGRIANDLPMPSWCVTAEWGLCVINGFLWNHADAMGRRSHRRCMKSWLADGVRLSIRFRTASEFQQSNHVDDEIKLWGGPHAGTYSYVFWCLISSYPPIACQCLPDPEEKPLCYGVLSLYPFSWETS